MFVSGCLYFFVVLKLNQRTRLWLYRGMRKLPRRVPGIPQVLKPSRGEAGSIRGQDLVVNPKKLGGCMQHLGRVLILDEVLYSVAENTEGTNPKPVKDEREAEEPRICERQGWSQSPGA